MITIEHINAVHKSMWEDAIERHGDKFKVPSDEVNRISQQTRALYVLMGWNGTGSPARLLSSYSIPTDIITDLVAEYYDETVAVEELTTPRPKRADKYSYPTTLKFLQDSPTFRKVKKGLWEVRDAVADKKADKS